MDVFVFVGLKTSFSCWPCANQRPLAFSKPAREREASGNQAIVFCDHAHVITSSLLYSIEQKQVPGPTHRSKVRGAGVITHRYEHQGLGS